MSEIIIHFMPRTKMPPVKERPEFSIHTVTLTTDEIIALKRLSQAVSDVLGRSISNSAIVRALVRKADQGSEEDLCLEVEKELNAGVRWGKQK